MTTNPDIDRTIYLVGRITIGLVWVDRLAEDAPRVFIVSGLSTGGEDNREDSTETGGFKDLGLIFDQLKFTKIK